MMTPLDGAKLLSLRNACVVPIACMLLMAALLAGCDSGKPHFDAPRAYMPAADIYGQALDYMVADDWSGAIPLLDEASVKGNAQAKYQLGLLYAHGEHAAQDLDKARELLLDAGKLGYAKAHFHLGQIYGTGDGVERNYQEAYAWFWLASSLGDKNAMRYMRIVLPKLSAQQYQEAEIRMKQIWDEMPPESKKDRAAQTSAMH
ncbi:MAG: hypothetical protein R8K46_06810 [Mariprofundaceae bacterium]